MECGGCTLCCKLLETHDVPSKIGVYCHHCEPGVGCSIHNERPKECRIYQCMWSQMEHVGEELRPDKCHIIFDRIGDDVITARLDEDEVVNGLIYQQIQNFVNEGFSLMVFRGGERKYFLSDKHTKDYVLGVVRGRA